MKFYFTGNYSVNFIAREFEKLSNYEIVSGEYCQYFQDIVFSNSIYYKDDHDFTVVFLDGEELLYSLKTFDNIKYHIENIVSNFMKNREKGYLILSNIYIPLKVNALDNYNKDKNDKKLQAQINLFLNDLAVKYDRFFVFDLLSIIEGFGVKNIYDNNTWFYARNRFNKEGLKLIANDLLNLINSILANRKKCLVLDLDNTLWGGVIGEDGLSGIKLSAEGIGEIYKKFQEEILKIKNKGILLAICSKNNIEDAKEVFNKHQFMVLKWEDFIIHKINWNLKSKNIKEIAKELNIAEESLVFIDDNPTEREIVKTQTDCQVPDFPKDISNLLDFIAEIDKKYFSIQNLSKEDIAKTRQYKENIQRKQLEKSFDNYIDFINSLNIKLTIFKNKKEHINRIAQMTQKTNQFNYTTKRYSTEDIKKFIKNKDYIVYSGRVEDRFGDYGIVILAIVKLEQDEAVFDTFLMSCRVIGKYVEDKFLEFISKDCNKQTIVIEYFKTKKNIVIGNKLEDMGFKPKIVDKDKVYKLYEIKTPIRANQNIKMEVKIEK